MKKIKWGIIGLGKIANKFAEGLTLLEDAELYGVASRNINNAVSFSKKHKAKAAYGSYEQLMQDKEVHVIYISTPHVFHYELTMDCLKNGKAVLCEKPFAMNLIQAEKMVALSRSSGLFLMEALWTRFLPHYQFVMEKVKSGELGKIRSVMADFGFAAEFDKTKRLFNKGLGGGSLLDIGIYPVFLAYSLLGKPNEIEAKAEFAETGVDASCDIAFQYNEGVKAELYSTLLKKTPTTAEIDLENGKIVLNSRFHEPTSVSIFSEGNKETFEFGLETNGYNFEAEHVTKMLLEGKTESDIWDLDKTLDLMKLLDAIRSEIGLVY